MYREVMSTLTHSFNLNDPHMQMRYIWARTMLKRAPVFSASGRYDATAARYAAVFVFTLPFCPVTLQFQPFQITVVC